MAGIENMAEGASPGPEVAARSNVVSGEANNSPASSINKPTQSEQVKSEAPRNFTTEQLLKLSPATRFSFLQALPPGEQAAAMGVLKLEIKGGAPAPDWVEDLKEATKQKSEFQETLELYTTLEKANKNRDKIPAARLAEFDQLLEATQGKMDQLIEGALTSPLFAHKGLVKERIMEVYSEARQALYILQNPPPKTESDSYYGGAPTPKSLEEILADVHKALGKEPDSADSQTGVVRQGELHYKEVFWEYGEESLMKQLGLTVDEVRKLKQDYEGIFGYLASKVGIAIEKDFRGLSLNPDVKVQGAGDKLFLKIKQEHDRELAIKQHERREKRKRASRYERLRWSTWRDKFTFTWAETPEELRDTVYIWLNWFQEQLRDDAEEKIYNDIGTALQQARSSLEQMLPQLAIETDSPLAKELRSTIDSYVSVIGGVKLLEKGSEGFEAYTKFLTDFAKDFTTHHDAIYLGNVKSAIVQDFLSDGAISLGGPDDIIKPEEGDTKDYREELEIAAKRYAETHELYLKEEDFQGAEGTRYSWNDKIEEMLLQDSRGKEKAKNQLGEYRQMTEAIEQEVAGMGLPADQVQQTVSQRVIEELRKNATNEDEFNEALADYQERWNSRKEGLAKVEARTGVFRAIKERLDKEDKLDKLTPEQRQQIIRDRIRAEMDKREGKRLGKKLDTEVTQQVTERFREFYAQQLVHLDLSPAEEQAAINARMAEPQVQQALQKQITDAKGRAYWGWLEQYNTKRGAHSKEKWFPSSWDRVRLNIDRSTKLIDRALTKEEFKAMIEEVDDPYINLTEEEIKERLLAEFNQEITQNPYLQELNEKQLDEEFNNRYEAVIFQKEQRRTEAESAFNINRAYQKFLGVDARWGGLTTRFINDEGEVEMKTLYDEIDEIIESKLNLERAQIEEKVKQWRQGFLATNPGLTQAAIDAEAAKAQAQIEKDYPNATAAEKARMLDIWMRGFETVAKDEGLTDEQIEDKTIAERRLLRRHATFAVRLALEEVGIKGKADLAMYSDPQMIKEATLLLGYTDDNKEQLLEVLERDRREEEAAEYYVLQKYMEKTFGGFLVVRDDPDLVIEDKEGKLRKYHEEEDVRGRVINEGGDFTLRNIFESAAMISTSGGVKVPDLIVRLGNLGVKDFLRELGCKDFRELQGRLKRRDEAELRRQSFFHTRYWTGPVSWVKRLQGANNARKFLVGGEVQGQGYLPGVLNEPYNGLWRLRDEYLEFAEWMSQNLKEVMSGTRELPKLETEEDWRNFLSDKKMSTSSIKVSSPAAVKRYKAWALQLLSRKDLGDYIKVVHKDKMVPVGGEILKFLISYMDSRRYVMNRAGFAPKNWQYDNLVFLRNFFGLTHKTKPVTVKAGDLMRVDKDDNGNPVPVYWPVDGDYTKGDDPNYQGPYKEEYKKLSQTGGEMVGGDHLAYAPEGRTAVASDFFTTILSASSYHILDAANIRTLDGLAWHTKEAMEAKRTEIKGQGLPARVQGKIEKRATYLKEVLHAKDETIEKEKEKLENEYYEDRLHKEFVGEWSTRLLAA